MPWRRCGLLLVLCVCPLACVSVSPCPAGCCCRRPGVLVLCESLGLRSLPRSVPPGTSALSVARNQLCNVDHLLQRFSGLQELSLSHNLLQRFPRGLPPSLESLLLQENRITYVTSGALRRLGNLTRLDLDDNRIRAIQPGALQGLGKLQVLTLKGNKLTSLALNLPPSLTRLDVSANCIAALDPASLSALINLQVLKVNRNCLRSVPEGALDGLPRLRSVDLANNLWACECGILYLYRWLLAGRLKMATELVCSEPVHLAHRLLLNLSVMAICPGALRPQEGTHQPETFTSNPSVPGDRSSVDKKRDYGGAAAGLHGDAPNAAAARARHDRYSLETLSYEDCLSSSRTVSPSHSRTTTSAPIEEQRCGDTTEGRYPQVNATRPEGTRPLLPTDKEAPAPTPTPTASPRTFTRQDPAVVCLLAVLCALVLLLTTATSLVLRKLLQRRRRVAPLDGGPAG